MLSQIENALSQGVTSDQIIEFLLKKFPNYSSKIKNALTSGVTSDQILKFLSKGKNKGRQSDYGVNTEFARTSQRDIETTQNRNKSALATSALAASPILAQGASAVLSRALPQSLISGFLSTENANKNNLQYPDQPYESPEQLQPEIKPTSQQQNFSQQPPVSNILPEQTNYQQTERKINPIEYLTKKGILGKVQQMAKNGYTPENIAAVLGIKKSGRSEIDPELLQNIEAYAKMPEEGKVEEIKKPIEEHAGTTVITPQGIGEVKVSRNGQSVVDVDGKKHKISDDELISSPIPQQDLADVYEDLLRGIESETGEQVSRSVNVAAYDPNTNSLAFIPHEGSLYIYDDLSDEDKNILLNSLKERSTTGSSHIGAWREGTKSPMGSQMSQLIRKLQSERGGKGQEYSRKYSMIYRALGHAEELHKKKYKGRKS